MRRIWVVLAVCALLAAPVSGGAVLITAGLAAAAPGECAPAGSARQVTGVDLDAEQLANASLVTDVTSRLGLPPRAAVIAVATALQESSLRNVDHGDAAGPDSRGLFQQRIRYYGADVATDPARATAAFLVRLVELPNWATIPLTEAAAQVQRPRADLVGEYARWEPVATDLVASAWPGPMSSPPTQDPGAVGAVTVSPAATPLCAQGGDGVPLVGGEGLPAGYVLPSAGQGATAVRQALAQVGKPYVWGGVGPDGFDCSGLTMTSWAAAGVAIPRTAAVQSTTGVPVPGLSALQPGDLLFLAGSLGTASAPGHNGMYIGTVNGVGYLVHAPQSGRSVEVRPLSRWDGLIVAIRRPIVRPNL